MKLTKAGMAENLYEEIGLSKSESRDLVGLFFDAIGESLENGDRVKITGFGNFELRRKKERSGRNPKTGEEYPISARRVVTFHAGEKLKERLMSGDKNGDESDENENDDAREDSQTDSPAW